MYEYPSIMLRGGLTSKICKRVFLMEEQIAKAYMSARRFDEGEIIQDEKYTAIRKQQRILEDQMIAAFGKGMEVLLEDYACAIYDEMELEAQHFF